MALSEDRTQHPVTDHVPLGLYVHLPWCVAKCPYCDFNSHALRGALPEDDYLDALAADLAADAPVVGSRRVDTIFIGGGTPSLFSADGIARLLEHVGRCLHVAADAEITLEANPGTLEADRYAGFRQAGVNRLSIGVQSFSDRHLKALGRIHDADRARRAIDAALAAGFAEVNVDLMFGLPDQSVAQAACDIDAALAFDVTHVSWYQLTLEPNTLFHARPPVLPDEDTAWAMQQLGQERLGAAGYARYEVSAYARAGHRCRHNINYWRFGDYLGVGAGAHGKVTLPDGRRVRTMKQRHPARYVQAAGGADLVAQRRELDAGDLVFEFMLNALRLDDGFDERDFALATGLNLVQSAGAMLDVACDRGMLANDGLRWRPTELGQRFLNDLQAVFLGDAHSDRTGA